MSEAEEKKVMRVIEHTEKKLVLLFEPPLPDIFHEISLARVNDGTYDIIYKPPQRIQEGVNLEVRTPMLLITIEGIWGIIDNLSNRKAAEAILEGLKK